MQKVNDFNITTVLPQDLEILLPLPISRNGGV